MYMDKIVYLEDIAQSSRKALIIGVGGGGDIVGAIPTARLLEQWHVTCTLGGLAWERFIYDPQPGTRTLEEVQNVQAIAKNVWIANEYTVSNTGVRFSASNVAKFYGKETVLIDLSCGVKGVVDGIRAMMQHLEADLIVGIDVGGDSLASGGELRLQSPLADGMMLAAINELSSEYACLWGVVGYGSDGELTPAEINKAISLVATHGGFLGAWGITPKVAGEMKKLLEYVPTDASSSVVEAALGAIGTKKIRQGTQEIELSHICSTTFFLAPTILYRYVAKLAQAVSKSESLESASDILVGMGIPSEYAFEQDMLNRGLTSYVKE